MANVAAAIPVATAVPIGGTATAPRMSSRTSSRSAAPAPPPVTMNPSLTTAVREFLTANLWPEGLQEYYLRRLTTVAATYFIVDDSGSMSISDATRFVKQGTKMVPVGCTRYAELQECITFHAGLANSARFPASFRLLNNAPPITVGGPGDDGSAFGRLMQALELPPSGGTPLGAHVRDFIDEVSRQAATLRSEGKRAKLIIATDGEASDGDLSAEMAVLKSLPVVIVVRICTNDSEVVDYWNAIDKDLELSLDIVDDLVSEAESVANLNPWLFYTEPIQRFREAGSDVREVELLDEVKFTGDQIRNFCILL